MQRRWMIAGASVSTLLALDVVWRIATGQTYLDVLVVFLVVASALVAVEVAQRGYQRVIDRFALTTGGLFVAAAVIGLLPLRGHPVVWSEYRFRLEVYGAFLAVAAAAWVAARVVGRRA